MLFFSGYEYFSLEDLDARAEVTEDPRGFLERRKGGFIIDEAQHAHKHLLRRLIHQILTARHAVDNMIIPALAQHQVAATKAGTAAAAYINWTFVHGSKWGWYLAVLLIY